MDLTNCLGARARGLLTALLKSTALAVLFVLLGATVASASDVAASVVDVDAPTGSVSLAAGQSGNIKITLTVTGKQGGTATFKVYKDWTLTGGSFTGSNPEMFTVLASPWSKTVDGTLSVASGHVVGGPFTLSVAAFDITNTSQTAKLSAGSASSYAVMVAPPPDSSPPVLTPTVTGTKGANDWYTSDVNVSWSVTDGQSTPVVDSGCISQTFSSDTTGVTSSCSAHSAGGSDSKSVTVKIDKTAPTNVSLAPSGTEGSNGWYTSNVTVATSGDDETSGATCTADQALTNETAGQTVNGSCTNGAGLTANAPPLTVKIDKSGPSASLAVKAGAPGTNGWYTSDVTVTASGADNVSGPVTCTDPVTLTDETDGMLVKGSCANAAGLSTQAAPLTVKIDKSNPTAVLSPSGTIGSGGWYRSPVIVSTEGADTVSTPVSCTADQKFGNDTAGTPVNGSCTNDAGLTQNAEAITLKIDQTPPSATLAVTAGTKGDNGWYTSDVTVHASGTDATSGIASCTADKVIDNETGGTEVTGSCTDNAGNTTEAQPVMIKIDKTAPSATLGVTAGTLGSNGWYTSNVTVGTTGGNEDLSNPLSCSGPQGFDSDTTGTTVNGSCTNQAGLTGNAVPLTIKIDKTAPANVAFVGGISDGASFSFGSVPPKPTCSASDLTSQLASCIVSGYSAAVGSHTLTATATDNAGNVSTATVNYSVQAWRLSGFYAPVDMDSTTDRVVNGVKNGSTVPLKFEVFAGSTELTDTASVTSLRMAKSNCALAGSVEQPIEAFATGGTALRYDTTAGQFIYNWKTPTGRDTCYDVIVGTADGGALTAHFRLK